MKTIEQRCQDSHTGAFVAVDTVDALAEKLVGIVGNRRMTKMFRYMGEHGGVPEVRAGLVPDYQGLSGDPVNRTPGHGVSIHLTGRSGGLEGVGLSIERPGETEEQAAHRYHHPEESFPPGKREEVVYVQLNGNPGQPGSQDRIRIERWNEYGVGIEVIVVFDDVDPVEEIFWRLTGNKLRHPGFEDYFCTGHEQHFADPAHEYRYKVCEYRDATLTENVAALALVASSQMASDG